MIKKNFAASVCIISCLFILVTGCKSGGPQAQIGDNVSNTPQTETSDTVSSLAQAKTGDAVSVEYTGKLPDGTIFDSSAESGPLEFTLGQGQIIPGLEQSIAGMKIGESRTITIPADQAYGQRNDDLIQVVPRNQLPEYLEPEVGMQLQSTRIDGETAVVTVVEVTDTSITIDANSSLAGKDLTFDIKLTSIVTSTTPTSSSSEGAELASIPLDKALLNGKPSLAEFGRGTCIPCKQMKPILEDLAVQYKDRLNVSIVSIDDYRELTSYYKIMIIPTQIGFDRNGKEVFRHIGAWPKDQIISELLKIGIK
jgi:peptidylprolyl isomerase